MDIWGRVNTAAILYLLFVLTAIVLAGVSQSSPKWAEGSLSFHMPQKPAESSKRATIRAARDSLRDFEQCDPAKSQKCDVFACQQSRITCSTCCMVETDIYSYETHGNLPLSRQSATFVGEWERGLKERCETIAYDGKTEKVCSKKKQLFSSEDKKMDSNIQSITDMLTAGLIIEIVAFVARIIIIVMYDKFPLFSPAFRAYILLPVADVLLKILSLFLFIDTMRINETSSFGFLLYAISVACSALSLVAAIVDEFQGTRTLTFSSSASSDRFKRVHLDDMKGEPGTTETLAVGSDGASTSYEGPILLPPREPPPRYESPHGTPRDSPPSLQTFTGGRTLQDVGRRPSTLSRLTDRERPETGLPHRPDSLRGDHQRPEGTLPRDLHRPDGSLPRDPHRPEHSLPRGDSRGRSQRKRHEEIRLRHRNRSVDGLSAIGTPNSGRKLGTSNSHAVLSSLPPGDELRRKRCENLGSTEQLDDVRGWNSDGGGGSSEAGHSGESLARTLGERLARGSLNGQPPKEETEIEGPGKIHRKTSDN